VRGGGKKHIRYRSEEEQRKRKRAPEKERSSWKGGEFIKPTTKEYPKKGIRSKEEGEENKHGEIKVIWNAETQSHHDQGKRTGSGEHLKIRGKRKSVPEKKKCPSTGATGSKEKEKNGRKVVNKAGARKMGRVLCRREEANEEKEKKKTCRGTEGNKKKKYEMFWGLNNRERWN